MGLPPVISVVHRGAFETKGARRTVTPVALTANMGQMSFVPTSLRTLLKRPLNCSNGNLNLTTLPQKIMCLNFMSNLLRRIHPTT